MAGMRAYLDDTTWNTAWTERQAMTAEQTTGYVLEPAG